MKRFRFRFEAVERVRKTREQEGLRALGAAQRAFQTEVLRRRGLEDAMTVSLARREELGREAAPGSAFQLETEFIEGQKKRLAWADQAITRAKKAVEKALRNYLNVRKQLRMIETIREKDFAEFRKERAKREARDLDDLYTMRARMSQQEAM